MLMYHISSSDKTRKHLPILTEGRWLIMRHFFDFRVGDGIANNFEGFLRSLLYQITKYDNETHQDEKEYESAKRLGSAEGLWRTLLSELKRMTNRRFVFFLDGLDESQGSHSDLAIFLRRTEDTGAKICIASRPSHIFDAAFSKDPSLQLQNCNLPSIEKFVKNNLKRLITDPDFHRDDRFVRLPVEIALRAEGVFLWAYFALYELVGGWARGEEPQQLQGRLSNLPAELGEIYSRIAKGMSEKQRLDAGFMLQLVCFAKRRLSVLEPFGAIDQAPSNLSFSQKPQAGASEALSHLPGAPFTKLISGRRLNTFEKKLRFLTGGLLDIPSSSLESNNPMGPTMPFRRAVSLIHRTVVTWLDLKGWQELLGKPHKDCDHAEAVWTKVCAAHFPVSYD